MVDIVVFVPGPVVSAPHGTVMIAGIRTGDDCRCGVLTALIVAGNMRYYTTVLYRYVRCQGYINDMSRSCLRLRLAGRQRVLDRCSTG